MIGKLLSFTAGVAVGGIGVYVYLTKYKKIEYEIVRPAIQTPQNEEPDYDNMEIADEEAAKIKEAITEDVEPTDKDLMDYFEAAKDSTDKETIDYSSFSKSEIQAERAAIFSDETPTVFEISVEEYSDQGAPFHNKATIAVYDDGAFVDETGGGEEVWYESDIDNFLSKKLADDFVDSDRQSIVIRNLVFGTDYDIYKRHERWEDIQELSDE